MKHTMYTGSCNYQITSRITSLTQFYRLYLGAEVADDATGGLQLIRTSQNPNIIILDN